MQEEHYTKSEINLMHKPMDEKLDKILVQTTKHNGRMDKVEKRQYGFTVGLTVVVVILLPLLVWALNTIVDLKSNGAIDTEKVVSQLREDYILTIK